MHARQLVDLKVRTAYVLTGRGYSEEQIERREPGIAGLLTGEYQDSHGLCFEVIHSSDAVHDRAWYDADEIVLRTP